MKLEISEPAKQNRPCSVRSKLQSVHVNSESSELSEVLICLPTGTVSDPLLAEKNGFLRAMDLDLATAQVEKMNMKLESLGVTTILLNDFLTPKLRDIAVKLPNLLFPRDLGVIVGQQAIIGFQPLSLRREEFLIVENIFSPDCLGLKVREHEGVSAEFGDFVRLSKSRAMINIGNRTTKNFIESARDVFLKSGITEIISVELPQKSLETVHLDLTLNVINETALLCGELYKHLWVTVHDLTSPEKKSQKISFIDWCSKYGYTPCFTTTNEQTSGVTNYLFINPEHVITGNPSTRKYLSAYDIKVDEINLSEIWAGSGGIRCATLALKRK